MLELVLTAVLGTQPNIIFFLSDDHSCNAVGAYGSVINETPHIDRLAAEGATFDRAFCNNGICAPSRAAFLTGVHGYINGVEDNGQRFDGSQPTIASLLHDAGYDGYFSVEVIHAPGSEHDAEGVLKQYAEEFRRIMADRQ